MALTTGMRTREILKLRWDNIIFLNWADVATMESLANAPNDIPNKEVVQRYLEYHMEKLDERNNHLYS